MSAERPTAAALYRRLLGYAFPHWKLFLLATLAMAIYAATDTGFAALMKPMLDDSFVEKDADMIRRLPFLLIGLFVVRGIAGFISTYGMNWVGRKVIQILRGELFRHLLRLPVSYYDTHSGGESVSKLIYDVEQVARASTDAITILIRDTLTIVFLMAYMFYIEAGLAALFLIMGPVIALLVRYVSKRFRSISRRIQGSMADVTQIVEEVIDGQEVVKSFGGQDFEQQSFERINQRNRRLHMKMIATSAASVPVVQLIAACTLAVVIYLATRESMVESITPGSFVSFIAAMLLLMPPLKRLTSVNSAIQKGIAAAESIFGLLDAETELDQGQRPLQRAQGAVEFRNVRFAYNEDPGDVIRGIDLRIEPGQTVALVGRSGSGKTTLASLLPRFYDVTGGEVLLDGVDIREYRLPDLRDQIALVGQRVTLFNASIRDNIAYGRLRESDGATIEKAAEAAHAMDFIRKLPQGMDTQVGEQGSLLSGGQRQRVAIARALLKDAPILIMDEATSALDTESERAVQGALETLMEGRTTLVIAHRLSTVEKADRILVLDEGRVIEDGCHADLLAADGAYAALYRMQFHEPEKNSA